MFLLHFAGEEPFLNHHLLLVKFGDHGHYFFAQIYHLVVGSMAIHSTRMDSLGFFDGPEFSKSTSLGVEPSIRTISTLKNL